MQLNDGISELNGKSTAIT